MELIQSVLVTKSNFIEILQYFIFSNFQTTSVSKALLYLLSKNKSKQEKLRSEVMKVLPEIDTPLSAESIRNVPYLRAVIKETLRIYPPVAGNGRELNDDYILQGYQIPKGTLITFPTTSMCRSDEYFPKAMEFIPERWLRDGSNAQEGCPFCLLYTSDAADE